MTVKRLENQDFAEAKEVISSFFTRDYDQEAMLKFLSDDKNYMLVCITDDKVAGFAYGYQLQRFDGRKNMMYVHQVEVLPGFRKRGIGKMLMKAFIAISKTNGCGSLFLITNKSNVAAMALYENSGGKAPSQEDVIFTFELTEENRC